MKEDKKADRAAWKEERSGSRDGVEKDIKAERERERQAVMLVYSRANVVRDWERRNQLGKKGEEFNKET